MLRDALGLFGPVGRERGGCDPEAEKSDPGTVCKDTGSVKVTMPPCSETRLSLHTSHSHASPLTLP